jgi:hypothetical protein
MGLCHPVMYLLTGTGVWVEKVQSNRPSPKDTQAHLPKSTKNCAKLAGFGAASNSNISTLWEDAQKKTRQAGAFAGSDRLGRREQPQEPRILSGKRLARAC